MNPHQHDLSVARRRMVDEQLRTRGIHDLHVLRIMQAMPRHLFVDDTLSASAYSDHALPIGDEQTISQPYMVALMTQALELRAGERVLEIGTGSGYQTAVLAALGASVVSVERIPGLAERAREVLRSLGHGNARIEVGDGGLGWPPDAPYDAILVTAGAPQIPRPLLDQLGQQGRLVLPMGEDELQSLVRLRRGAMGLIEEYLGECRFVKLRGRYGWDET